MHLFSLPGSFVSIISVYKMERSLLNFPWDAVYAASIAVYLAVILSVFTNSELAPDIANVPSAYT